MLRPSLRGAAGAAALWMIGLLGLMVVMIISGALFWTSLGTDQSRIAIEERRSRSLEAIVSATGLEAVALDRQRMIRGYILSRGELGMEGMDPARVSAATKSLATLIKGDRDQERRAARLLVLLGAQADRIRIAKDRVDAGEASQITRLVVSGVGENGIDEVRTLVDAIVQRERARLDSLRVETEVLTNTGQTYTYVIGLTGLLILVCGGTVMMMSLNNRWRNRFKDVEQRLDETTRNSERRMRIAHEATGAGTWETVHGSPVWSKEMFRLYGISEEAGFPSQSDWKSLVHPDDVRDCPWTSWNALATISFERTFRIATASGGWRWIVSRGFSFEDGDDVRSVGMDVDVTEQVSNREELARLNDILSREAETSRLDKELVFEATGDLMAVIEADGTLRAVNPAWSRVLGTPATQVLGQCVTCFVAPGSQWAGVGEAAIDMLSADGGVRTIEWSVVSGPDGVTIAAGRDVTMQRQAEMRLRDAEDAVRQMQKIETVGQMTGGIAHDFNNMLTPITGFLDLLARRHADDVKSSRMINMAQQSADKAKTLVSKLLSFARRQQLDARVVDTCSLIGGMNELVEKAIAGSGIDLQFTTDGEPRCVRIDPNQFEMVVLNLAVNARDAMPEGGRLSIDVRRHDAGDLPDGLAPGAYVVVEVKDAGTGMSPEVLARAVEPFYSTKGAGKGTGLGLSMAHGMAAQSGGTLVLRSVLGSGTSASIWLPEVDPRMMPASDDGAPVPDIAMRPLKVLLVDDDDLVRASIEQMLSSMGHVVTTASSGAQALSIFASKDDFDVLVTDYLMPTMTGVELVSRIREMHESLPAVIVSGYTALKDQDSIPDTTRLSKPFTSARLIESLGKVVPSARTLGTVVELRRRS
jgi:signal transduction histidine kinase/CHASE3 domain sensor protein